MDSLTISSIPTAYICRKVVRYDSSLLCFFSVHRESKVLQHKRKYNLKKSSSSILVWGTLYGGLCRKTEDSEVNIRYLRKSGKGDNLFYFPLEPDIVSYLS